MRITKKIDREKQITHRNIKGRDPKTGNVKTSRLGFRASEPQAKIIRLASDISHKSLTDFIMDSAYKAAEEVILDQRIFMVSEEVYVKFSEILDRNEQGNKGLKELFSAVSPWDANDHNKT